MHRTGSIKLIQTRTKGRSNAFLHAWFVLGFNTTVTLIFTFSTIAGAHRKKIKNILQPYMDPPTPCLHIPIIFKTVNPMTIYSTIYVKIYAGLFS